MRVAVAGAGANIFGAHRRGLTAVGAVVGAVQDADLGRARRVGAELDCAVCADVSALLEVPSDVVVVLAPHPFRGDLAYQPQPHGACFAVVLTAQTSAIVEENRVDDPSVTGRRSQPVS